MYEKSYYQLSHVIDMVIIASDYDAGLWKVFVGRHLVLYPERQAALQCVSSEKGRFAMQSTKVCSEMQEGWKSQKDEMAFYLELSLNVKKPLRG